MPKTITNNQILGELGVAFVQTNVLRMGFTWHPSNGPVDAGIDGWIELRDAHTGKVANTWLSVQSKARTTLERESNDSYSFTCSLADLEYWLTGNAPVILVVSNPDTNEGWWVSVKDYFANKDYKRDRRIIFDKKRDRFDPNAADDLKALGSRVGAGTYFTPLRRQEALVSNLLRIKDWQQHIYRAPTTHRTGGDLRDALKQGDQWPPREWLLHEGHVYSFHDLKNAPWSSACDSDAMQTIATNDWALSDSRELQHNFVRLLNQCLRDIAGRWFMSYADENECFHFRPTRDLLPRKVFYKSAKRKSNRVVFKAYEAKADATRIAYYRHDGFSHRFRQFGGQWFLEISPTYVFTSDGKKPDPYREERLAKIKTFEGDAAVAGRVLMFADILRDRPSLFAPKYPFLTFGELENVLSEVSINDDSWSRIRADEPAPADDDTAQGNDAQKVLF